MKLVSLAAAAFVFASPAFAADTTTPAGVVDSFSAALKAGDAATLEKLLAPDVLIAESGGAERSFAEYAGHHMPADMAFTKAVTTSTLALGLSRTKFKWQWFFTRNFYLWQAIRILNSQS